MFRLNAVVIFLSLLLAAASSSAQIYRWVDEQGRVQFSDKPQSEKAEILTLESSPSGWKPLDIEVVQQGTLAGHTSAAGAAASSNDHRAIDTARIQQDVNRVYRFYDQVMYFDFYQTVPVKIHLLANRAEYLAFVRAHLGADASQALGIYIPALHKIAVYLHEEEIGGINSTYATIRHEASHAILDSVARRMPLWLNEGMAEQMETLLEHNGQLVLHAHTANRRVCLQWPESVQQVLPFMEARSDYWQRANLQSGTNQAMAGQLVYHLLSKNYGRSLITRLLQDYKRGVNVRSYYLLDEHYIGGRKALDIHWKQWLKSGMNDPAVIRF